MSDLIINKAQQLDQADPLRQCREQFLLPATDNSPDIYFVGNSLGLQPAGVATSLSHILQLWQHSGVHGHFEGSGSATAWMDMPQQIAGLVAPLVGAAPEEVVIMNTLTVNLHLLLASFYRPTGTRRKILIEQHAFPSDHHAVASFLRIQGEDPDETLLTIPATRGGFLFDTGAVLEHITAHSDTLALVLLPGVQYYTGQVLDIDRITRHVRSLGIAIGWDLAHAVGNIPLQLSEWGPDFACWCSYKYLNGGPGAPGGCFIRSDHCHNTSLQRLAGWWGHERSTRFQMRPDFVPAADASGWQLSNPPILSLAATQPALELFQQAGGMRPLRQKSLQMTQFFRECLQHCCERKVTVLTPESPAEHGCQLSLEIHADDIAGRDVYNRLLEAGIHTDWREPNVIRAAPVPLYNTFSEIAHFAQSLARILQP